MAQKQNTQLQQFFQTGDIPSQQNYFDLLDSYVNLVDETNTNSNFKLLDSNDVPILQTPVGRIIFGDINLPIDIQSNVTASGYITAGNITASGDISASGTLFGGGLNINGTTTFNDGDITNVGTIDVDFVRADTSILDFINLGTNNITTVINGTNTFVVKPKIIEIGTSGVNAHVTASGNISASGTVFANEFNIANISSSGTIVGTNFATNPFLNSKYYFNGDGGSNYLTAPSSTQVDLRMNGSQVVSFTNSSMILSEINNYNLSVGGKITGKSSLTVSGNISSSGDLSITGSSFIGGHITASGNISASGNILTDGNITTTEITSSGDIRIGFNTHILGRKNTSDGSTVQLARNVGSTLTEFGSHDVDVTSLKGDVILIDSEEGNIGFRRDGSEKLKFTLGASSAKIESAHPIEIQSTDDITLDAGGNNIYLRDGSNDPTIEFNTNTGLINGDLLKIDGSQVDFTNLPTSDPGVAGRLWQSGSTAGPDSAKFVVISQG